MTTVSAYDKTNSDKNHNMIHTQEPPHLNKFLYNFIYGCWKKKVFFFGRSVLGTCKYLLDCQQRGEDEI